MKSTGTIVALNKSSTHSFKKEPHEELTFIEGFGVEGDAHAGKTVKHRSRVRKDPTAFNLRQVHLIHAELLEMLNAELGVNIKPGDMGENVTTGGIDLLALPKGALLSLGPEVVIEVTGLRNPCTQLNVLHPSLMTRLVEKGQNGSINRLAGIMGVVLKGGIVRTNDYVSSKLPNRTPMPLEPV